MEQNRDILMLFRGEKHPFGGEMEKKPKSLEPKTGQKRPTPGRESEYTT